MWEKLAILTLSSLLAGQAYASGVYVGNVSFKAQEVCSREYTSTFSWSNGCLPVARSSHAQNYFFDDIRLPVPPEEAAAVEQAAQANEENTQTNHTPSNLLPSLLGRVFITYQETAHSDKEHVRYIVPERDGFLDFLLEEDSKQLGALPTEVLVSSDLSGVIKRQLSASAEADASSMVNEVFRLLNSKYSSQQKLQTSLQYLLRTVSTASGNFYYVSLTAHELAQQLHALRDYLSNQAHDRAESSRSAEPTVCNDSADIPTQVINTLNLKKNSKLCRNQGLGVIIGVSVLRTKAARTDLCSTLNLRVNATNGATDKNGSCNALQKYLTQNNDLSADEAGNIATVASLVYERESYKTLTLNNHAGVLAIHWIPLDVWQAQRPSKNATNPAAH